jgi:hypothetical protein
MSENLPTSLWEPWFENAVVSGSVIGSYDSGLRKNIFSSMSQEEQCEEASIICGFPTSEDVVPRTIGQTCIGSGWGNQPYPEGRLSA